MQPYLFPYIGYYQLINAVDKFVFYDDVNFIKGGWVNRNNILINNKKSFFTLNLSGASSNKKINQIVISNNSNKLLKTIQQNYSKAPFFKNVFPIIESIFSSTNKETPISAIAGESVIKVTNYIGLIKEFEFSSVNYNNTSLLKRVERLIAICRINHADTYVNAFGGKDLYSKDEFQKEDIKLLFLESVLTDYQQFNNQFIPGLSIIDVMMFNSPQNIRLMLNKFVLL